MTKHEDNYTDDDFWRIRKNTFKKEAWAILVVFVLYVVLNAVNMHTALPLLVVMFWAPILLVRVLLAKERRTKALKKEK